MNFRINEALCPSVGLYNYLYFLTASVLVIKENLLTRGLSKFWLIFRGLKCRTHSRNIQKDRAVFPDQDFFHIVFFNRTSSVGPPTAAKELIILIRPQKTEKQVPFFYSVNLVHKLKNHDRESFVLFINNQYWICLRTW